jgi:hypothetical protein
MKRTETRFYGVISHPDMNISGRGNKIVTGGAGREEGEQGEEERGFVSAWPCGIAFSPFTRK